MRGPVRKGEIRLLWVLFVCSLVSAIGFAVTYAHLEPPTLFTDAPFDITGKTSLEIANETAERANRLAFETIQNATKSVLRVRAFESAKLALILAAVTGYLLWRLRGIKAV